VLSPADSALVGRLLAGDEEAFAALVSRYHPSLVRLARTYVPSHAVAEEVAQDTWLALLRGLAEFEGRSSLQTWLFHILINRARSTGVREHRSGAGTQELTQTSEFTAEGAWRVPPAHWADEVDDRLSAAAMSGHIRDLIDQLPVMQRRVVTLRDVQGMSSAEVCDLLEVTEGNQRVLLHRARANLRRALQAEMAK